MIRGLNSRSTWGFFLFLLVLQLSGAQGAEDTGSSPSPLRVELADAAVRITGVSSEEDPHWVVLTRNGRSYRIDLQEGKAATAVLSDVPGELLLDHHEPAGGTSIWSFPGVTATIDNGLFTIRNGAGVLVARGRTLPDARPVYSDGYLALLTDPTESYRHGILGDGIEAAGFIIYDIEGDRIRESRSLAEGAVFEARFPIWADMTGDGVPELLLTTGSAASGAAVRIYRVDGSLLAESDPIGTGYRWLHLLGTLPTGPEGEPEVYVVRTPHIGGILESYRLADGTLEKTRSLAGYSTHMIRSRNLGMVFLDTGSTPMGPALLIPARDYRRLHLLRPDGDDFHLESEIVLADVLTSNISELNSAEMRAVAWGLADNSVSILIWPGAEGLLR